MVDRSAMLYLTISRVIKTINTEFVNTKRFQVLILFGKNVSSNILHANM